jgi:hypothetical protein
MEKQPFDENGLQALLLALYALPDPDLREEAYALRNQPKAWINGRFDLNEEQFEFLENLPPTPTTFLAQQGGFAVEHRLPIHLSQVQVPKEDVPGGKEDDKWFKPVSNLAISTDRQGQSKASGSLLIEVTYLV